MLEELALQDVLKVHCFGCGSLNERGLQIKSRWRGEELVCRWQPSPHHIGYPGYVYGGTIASIVDCHCIWAAMGTQCRDTGVDLDAGERPPFAYVTGRLDVRYLQPALIGQVLELRARVMERGERKMTIECGVSQGETLCASAQVIAVRVPMAFAT